MDITEQKRAVEALEKAHQDLERKVEERTRELRHLSSRLLLAHEEESKRIGQELHDGLAQTLSAIKIWVETVQLQMSQADSGQAAKTLERVVPLAKAAVDEIRRISKRLRPSILDDLGILAAISSSCQEFENTHPEISVEQVVHMRESDFPDTLKIVIYRILQEALNNIARHSRADLVRVRIEKRGGKIELAVYDNGAGFDVSQTLWNGLSDRGLGLEGMQERVTLSGGSLSIASGEGTGTRVLAIWPLEERKFGF